MMRVRISALLDDATIVLCTIAAAVYGKKGEYSKAIKDFSKAIELNPMFTEAYTKRTYSHLRRI